ncbi:basic secretory protein-like protein [Mucilaginibacter sp. KACC 22063]|uniref:basic secretory protein-like protein n=1 Tax=Mucilaginibacter sp. KACC 22063 TaxID=3025666 RepID=UPI0023664892|nr:basic secretory protein-like protein [Mucilaginibacter sp. KACC 22063]WDF54419.1 basic secretory protein-like protein [Mucilaginibacter sp. KACC 22063]
MKKVFYLLLLSVAFAHFAKAQDPEVIKKKGYTLTVINQDPNFSQDLKDKLISTFWIVYPKLAKAYNSKTSKHVTFIIDTTYNGVAATANDRVTFSAKYMTAHPQDIDVVTHEVMHIVQAYGDTNGPSWLTEGIADYARYKFGVNNAAAKWALPPYKSTQSYENSYRITARFLAWIEAKIKPGAVKALDSKMRDRAFTDGTWTEVTGKSLGELWSAYTADPAL